jgi:hypothetical protein
MVISDENSFPILIDNISTPLKMDYFWVLDLDQRDFVLSKIEVLEEHVTPTLLLDILGYRFEVPAHWNILVYSEETSQLDIAEISEVSRGHFTAFVFNHKQNVNKSKASAKDDPGYIKVLQYQQRGVIRTPSLNKYQMLCHHLGPDFWVCISPIDNYNKYLKDATIGDILP